VQSLLLESTERASNEILASFTLDFDYGHSQIWFERESGATLCSTDRDFLRFEGLKLVDPTR
jgi:hypothetical protein